MKRIAYIFGVFALVTASAISCQKETPVEEAEKADKNKQEQPKPATPTLKTLTFKITDGEDTKMVLAGDSKKYGSWESGDNIGYITSTSKNGSATVALGTPPTFTIAPEGGLAAGKTIDVWYPYRADQADPSAVQLVIPAAQTQDASLGFDFDAMPMVAERITVTDAMLSESNFQGSIQFANLGSVICFKVFSSNATYATEKVTSVSFNAESAIAGHFNFNLAGVNFSNETTLACSGYTARNVTTTLSTPATIGADKEDAADVFMVVAPGTHSGTIVVATDAAFYTYTLPSRDFSRSGLRSFGLDLGKTPSVRSLKYAHTWDLREVSYSSQSDNQVVWPYGIISMQADKASAGTNTNSYIPPTESSTRFYTKSTLSFSTPALHVEKIEYTATTPSYASAMAGSTWSNATTTVTESTVTIVPTDGSSAFNATITGPTGGAAMKVYFDNTDYSIGKASVEHGSFTVKKGDDEVSSAKVNTTITLTATPDDGYVLAEWTVTDAESNPVTVVGNTFQMPASNVTVSALFATTPYSIAITSPSHGTVSTSPSTSAYAGSTVTINAVPDTFYEVASITVTDEDSGSVTVTNNQFTMPAKAVTITVVFSNAYILNAIKSTTNTAYATYYTVTQSTVSWKVPGNQSFDGYWQIGGDKTSLGGTSSEPATRYICTTGETPIPFDVSTIVLATNGMDATSANYGVTSIVITAHDSASDANSGTSPVATFTTDSNFSFGKDTDKSLTFVKTGETNCSSKYFRITISMFNTTTTNHGLKIQSISFR